MKMKRNKWMIAVTLIVALAFGLTGCGGGAKEISEKKYQEIMSEMGLSGMEEAVSGITPSAIYKMKADFKEDASIEFIFSEQCGKKDTYYFGAYGAGEDEAAAAELRQAFIDFLVDAGYAFVSEDEVWGEYYNKDSYGVMVQDLLGPVNWKDVEGQYGFYVNFY